MSISKEEQIEEMAEVLSEGCGTCVCCWYRSSSPPEGIDCSDLKNAERLYNAGYRKQSEGEWEIVKGSNGKEKMVCTNCRHQQDLASTFTYCPNCGAKMKGV